LSLTRKIHYQRWRAFYECKQEIYFKGKTRLLSNEHYINTKIFTRLSDTASDLVAPEPPRITVSNDNEKTQEFIKLLEKNTVLQSLIKPLVRELSWRGCVTPKGILINKDGILQPKITTIDPEIIDIQFHPDDKTKILTLEIVWIIEVQGKKYLRKEIHKPYFIIQELWQLDNNDKPYKKLDIELFYEQWFDLDISEVSETGTEDVLVEYIPNARASTTDFEGMSDYEGLEMIVFAYENFLSETYNTTNKNLRPKWIVPATMAHKDKKGNLYFPNAEVYFSQPMQQTPSGLLVPAQLNVDINTDLIKTTFELLNQDLLMASELSPAAFGYTKDSMNIDSGKALKFRFYNPLQNAARKVSSLDLGLKRLVENLMITAKTNDPYWKNLEVEQPVIEWSNGLPNQWDEDSTTTMQLYNNGMGIISKKEALRLVFPNWTEEKIEQVLAEIEEENSVDLTDRDFTPIFNGGGF
jgi:hypothetical protein